MFDVVAIGEILIDFTPIGMTEEDIPLFAQNPGGGPANMLAANSILGGKTAFIGKVGDDNFAYFLKDTLTSLDIDTTGLVISDEVDTTLAFVHLTRGGERDFSFHRKPGADMMLLSDEVNFDIIDKGSIIHMSGLMITDEPSRSTCHTILKYVKEKENTILAFDPNYRAPIWSSREKAKEEILRVIPYVDILKVSDEELDLLTGSDDIEAGAKLFSDLGASLVLISLGEKGAYYYTKNHSGLLPTYKVDTVDTTGAGDSFLGSVLFKLSGKSKKNLENLTKDELEVIVDFANATGSLSTTKKGGIPSMPTLEEVLSFQKTGEKI